MSAENFNRVDPEPVIVRCEGLCIGYHSPANPGSGIIYGPLTMEIHSHEMIGIIGKNGIGKSTLLRTLAGIQRAISGKTYIRGREIGEISRSDKATLISYVSTEPVHVPNLRVKELISMGRFPYTNWFGKLTPRDLDIIEDAVELTGVHLLLDKPVYQLSDGERQKVMIARALAQDTPVIILDEPTAFLDMPARHETIRLLNQLSLVRNKLIIFSTHDLAIAMDEADKLWLMTEDGLLEGAPEDLLLNKAFRKLFMDSDLDFDIKSQVFKFGRELKRNIKVVADEKYSIFTCKAMERIGFKIITNEVTDLVVTVKINDNIPVWHVSAPGIHRSFHTIYQLTSYFRHEFNT